MLKVYIGFDPQERRAFSVAAASLARHASVPLDVQPLNLERLVTSGLHTRPIDRRGDELYDLISGAPQATEFALTRFLVPILGQSGWALYLDCDVVVLGDVGELLHTVDPCKAISVVQHRHEPTDDRKMAGKQQSIYERKNWSSLMLWNLSHPANRRLTLQAVNSWQGRDLHRLCWLHDAEIGALDAGWNWLVNEQPRPERLRVAHFTAGGPWLANWRPAPHDDIWTNAEREAFGT